MCESVILFTLLSRKLGFISRKVRTSQTSPNICLVFITVEFFIIFSCQVRRIAEQRRLKGEEEEAAAAAILSAGTTAAIIDPIFTDFSLNTTADSLSRGQLRFSLPPSGESTELVAAAVSTTADVTAATTPRAAPDQLNGGAAATRTTATTTDQLTAFTLDQLTSGAAATTGRPSGATNQKLIGTVSSAFLPEEETGRFLSGRATKAANSNKQKRFAGGVAAGAAPKKKFRRTNNQIIFPDMKNLYLRFQFFTCFVCQDCSFFCRFIYILIICLLYNVQYSVSYPEWKSLTNIIKIFTTRFIL